MHRQPICPRRRRAAPRHALASFAMVLCAGLTLSDVVQAQPDHTGADRIAAAATPGHPSAQRATAGNTRPEVLSPIPDQSHAEGDTVNLDLQVHFSDPDGDALNFNALDALPSGLSLAGGRITGTIDEGAAADRAYSIRIVVNDGNGGFVIDGFEWTVTSDNQPPVLLQLMPDVTTPEYNGDNLHEAENAIYPRDFFSDPDGDTLTFSATGLPSGASLRTSGRLSFYMSPTAAADNACPCTVTVTADDGNGGSVSGSFVWTIVETNIPPNYSIGDAWSNALIEEGEIIDGTTDDDFFFGYLIQDDDGDTLTFSITSGALPPGLSMSSDGIVSGTVGVGAADGSPHRFSVTADDGQGGILVDEVKYYVKNGINRPPFLVTPLDDLRCSEGSYCEFNAYPSFDDPDGNSFSLSYAPLPSGLTHASDYFFGTIDAGAADGSPYTVTVSADDGRGGIASTTFLLYVAGPTNRPPELSQGALPIQTHGEGDGVDLDLSSYVLDRDGDALLFALTSGSLPPGLSLSGEGRVSGTIGADTADGSPYASTATADDGNGGRMSFTLLWYVTGDSNRVPVLLGNVPDQTNVAGDAVDFDLASYIADPDGDALTLSIEGALPAGLSLTADGYVTGTLDANAANASPYALTVTADDGNGGSVSDDFRWVVHPQGMIFVGGFEATE